MPARQKHDAMKRSLSTLVIAVYLVALLAGLASHTLNFQPYSHPVMYFFVWDMYGGWCAFETRHHVLAQGESGQYYQVLPPPWGTIQPFGSVDRQHYDVKMNFLPQMAAFALRHTRHEPIQRIVIVEEAWCKKYNLPDELWRQRYDEPRRPISYFHIRAVADSDGRVTEISQQWPIIVSNRCLMDNPRLMSDMSRGHTFLAFDPERPSGSTVRPASFESGF
jgi:hypothetical protein